jgi:hypothetical protein
LGVIVEVRMDAGLDLLVAYADRRARYINHSGAAVIWEAADASLDPAIDRLLAAAEAVVSRIGPWEQARPEPPPPGEARLNFLTPSGLHFGQAATEVLQSDPMGGPVFHRAFLLMQGLMGKAERQPKT